MLGTLVQANHGVRDWLTVCGVPVGRTLRAGTNDAAAPERGSIIVVVATDIPMAPHQLRRVARRCALGIGRNGTVGGNGSGDIFLAFSTADIGPMPHAAPGHRSIELVNDELFDPIYEAVVQVVEEAVLNAMLAAETTGGTGHDRCRIEALPADELVELLARHGRLRATA